jgi:UMF1 family MFS transporter
VPGATRAWSSNILFLIAHMIYIDGLATVFAFGGVYAASTFDMREQEVLYFGIALNVTAGLGAAMFA